MLTRTNFPHEWVRALMTLGTHVRTLGRMVSTTVHPSRGFVRPETLGLLVMVLFPVQFILNVAFLVIQPERPLSDPNSLYALGHLGWLWQLGAIATGLGIVALALGLGQSLAKGKRVRFAVTTMLVAGLAVVGTGLYPSDEPVDVETVGFTITGLLHVVFGLVGILSLIIVTFALKGVFKRDPRWTRASRPTGWLAWWVLGSTIVFIALGESTAAGFMQRFVVPEVVWVLWIAWLVRRLGRRSPRLGADIPAA